MATFAYKPMLGKLTGKCPVCGRRVDRGAGLCGNCMVRRGAIGSIVVMVVGICGVYYWATMHPFGRYQAFVAEPAAKAADMVMQTAPSDFDGWAYSRTTDAVLEDVTEHARLLGSGPGARSGPHSASLELTVSEKYGKHVTIMFPRVQEACAANQCQVSLGWDDAPPEPYKFDPPLISPGGGNTVLQTDDYDRFQTSLRKARKLKVVASLGMPDDYEVMFPVAGFTPSKMQ